MNFFNELRYTLRVMGKNLKFTFLCVTVIAIGLGLVLPLYAFVDNLAFKSPPYPEGSRYVGLNKILTPGNQSSGLPAFDHFHYRYFSDNAKTFAALYAWQNSSLTVSDGEYVEVYESAVLEPGLLELPSVQPLMGRLFRAEDAQPGAAPVAIISAEVWQFYYAARIDIIGHTARINGESRTIVGVMPEGFTFPRAQQLWLPLVLPAMANAGEGEENLIVVGKLAASASVSQASKEISLLEANILSSNPTLYPAIASVKVVPYVQSMKLIFGSWIAVAFLGSIILLVAVNIGNLFIARGEERTNELAIRSALGAAPLRLAQSMLLESFMVCMWGLFLGLFIAYFGIAYLNSFIESASDGLMSRMFWWDMSLNGRTVTISVLAVLGIWLGSGGLPAWHMSRANLQVLIAGSSKGRGDRGNSFLTKILVNLQLIIGCVLLSFGVVQVISFASSQTNEVSGADLLYAATVNFADTPLVSAEGRLAYLDDLQRNLGNEPTVREVAFASAVPFLGAARRASFAIEEQELRINDVYPHVLALAVSENYLDVLNRKIIAGRGFNTGDTPESLAVAVIDERLADLYWPGESALGKRIQLDPADNASWLTVVGVSEPLYMGRKLVAGQIGTPLVYQPIRQADSMRLNLVAKFTTPPGDAQALIGKAATGTNRDIPVNELASFTRIGDRADESDTFYFYLFLGFILIALYLCSAATYGLAARAASRRRVETGIRMALGASPGTSMMVFIKDGFKMVVTGLGIGGTVAVLLSYWSLSMNETPVSVAPLLIPTVISISLIMGTLVMLANYFPAKKIIAMEPGDALRHE